MAQRKKKSKKKVKLELSGWGLFLWGLLFFVLLAWSFVLGILVGRGTIPESFKRLAELKQEVVQLQKRVKDRNPPQSDVLKTPKAEEEKFEFFQKLSVKKEERAVERSSLGSRKSIRSKPSAIASTTLRYTIQVASFNSKEKASALVTRLAKQGVSAYYVMAKTGNGIFYRVQCGDFSSRTQAASQLQEITERTGLKGFVCQRQEPRP
ncbi:MAG: hypothetical protein DRG63_07635 [Deltaproteobacteria bacterium]|nr:MAG: hypothetical protein DRG63_07635 [Deltaproteobacteria bacterium]